MILLKLFQSAYRSSHTTEIALLRVVNDFLCFIDSGNVSLLTLLDLSAAFDTLDHDKLINRLSFSFGIKDAVLNWIKSYISGRHQEVKIN